MSIIGQVISIEWNNYKSPGHIKVRYEEYDRLSRLIDDYNLNVDRVDDGVVYMSKEGAANCRISTELYIFTNALDTISRWANKVFTFPYWVENEALDIDPVSGLVTRLEAELPSGFEIPEIPGIEHAKDWWKEDANEDYS